MSQGKFVLVEGIDGSGKSTLCEGIHQYRIKYAKYPLTVIIPSPSKSFLGISVRSYMNSPDPIPLSLFLLMMADRAHVTNMIKDHVARGYLVLADRYSWSTLAYQRGEVDQDLLEILCVEDGLYVSPDLVIYLKCDPKVALAHLNGRAKRERYETSSELDRVSANYDNIYENYVGNKFLVHTTDMPSSDGTLDRVLSRLKESRILT